MSSLRESALPTVVAVIAITFSSRGALAASDDVILRASLDPSEDALVGQRIRLTIDVLGRDGWANLPKLPRPDLLGAVVYVPDGQAVRLNEIVEGGSYAGQRYELWIYPQRAELLTIPSFDVGVEIAQFGVGQEPQMTPMATSPLSVDVGSPPGAEAFAGLICTTRFDASQVWSSESEAFDVGDGVTRTIVRRISDAPGMALPPLPSFELKGVRQYPKQPSVDDVINRGDLTGGRSEATTYVFETPGTHELPTLSLPWWDVDEGELKQAVLPGRTVEVAAQRQADESDPVELSEEPARPGRLFALGALVLAGALLIVWPYRETLTTYFHALQLHIRQKEPAYFRRFQTAARTNDAPAALRSLMQWLDRGTDAPAARLDEFVASYGDRDAIAAVDALQNAVAAGDASWQCASLATSLRRARRRWLRANRHRRAQRTAVLPPLNP